jgi:hypothetical protein
MKNLLTTASVVALCAFSAPSYSHHGSNGQFDTSKEIDVAGVITDIRFVNPHAYIYFDVTNEEGSTDPWRCELRAGSMLKRTGWSTDMFKTGAAIKITGAPARREPFGCMTQSITFENGKTYARNDVIDDSSTTTTVDVATVLADGTPNLDGNWVALPREQPGRRGGDAETAGGPPQGQAGGPPEGGQGQEGGPPGGEQAQAGRAGGPPQGGRGGRRGPQYDQTELGKTASEGFSREDDNPRFHCQATNLFLDWIFDELVNNIAQSKDKIVMTFGFMDIVRTIHLDMDSHPKNIVPSRAGHSIGKWEGKTLVVDTIGFLPGYLDATFSGTKHSDKMHVTERFSLSEDGKTLNRAYTVEDPLYLAAPFEGSDSVIRTIAAYEPYNCEDLTEEVVEGF